MSMQLLRLSVQAFSNNW